MASESDSDDDFEVTVGNNENLSPVEQPPGRLQHTVVERAGQQRKSKQSQSKKRSSSAQLTPKLAPKRRKKKKAAPQLSSISGKRSLHSVLGRDKPSQPPGTGGPGSAAKDAATSGNGRKAAFYHQHWHANDTENESLQGNPADSAALRARLATAKALMECNFCGSTRKWAHHQSPDPSAVLVTAVPRESLLEHAGCARRAQKAQQLCSYAAVWV